MSVMQREWTAAYNSERGELLGRTKWPGFGMSVVASGSAGTGW